MSWLSNFLNPGKGYEKGQEQLDKYYQQANQFLQPYNQQGQEQYGNINQYIQSLMNPEELQNKWTQGYETSPYAKQLQDMSQQQGLNAASSMGLMGSNTALNAIQQGNSQIGMQDRQKYLDDIMQKYMQGAGLSQGIYNTGAGIAGNQGQNAMNMGQNSAQMAYGKQNAGGNMFSNLIGAGIGGFGSALGSKWSTKGGM